jgi:predicted transcriptional regulator
MRTPDMTKTPDPSVPRFSPVDVPPSAVPALLAQMTAHVVGIQLATTPTPTREIPSLFRMIHEQLAMIAEGMPSPPSTRLEMPEEARMEGQIDPQRWPGVFADRIVCLEDGRSVTLLKSYVAKRYKIGVAEYLRRWRLPADYPLVPSQYAERKRVMARNSGLGTSVRANKERRSRVAV